MNDTDLDPDEIIEADMSPADMRVELAELRKQQAALTASPPPTDGEFAALEAALTRDDLGRIVREAWVIYCKESGWRTAYETVCPWDEMTDEHAKEVDRRIGEAVVAGTFPALLAAHARAVAEAGRLAGERDSGVAAYNARMEYYDQLIADAGGQIAALTADRDRLAGELAAANQALMRYSALDKWQAQVERNASGDTTATPLPAARGDGGAGE